MKPLSQSEYGELRNLYESVYAPEVETILEGFTDEDLDLTDEEIEEQVEEVFLECIEEGYDIDEIENIICEAIDTELEVLNEVTSPAKVAALRMKNQNAAAAGEGRGGDAGAKARAKLNVSKQKVVGSSEKKASTLSRVKGAVKKVAKAAQGGVGLAARAVGTAQRAASAVKGAAKSGYERGRQGAGDGSSSSETSSASGPSSSSSSGGGSSSGSSEAPKKRKDGLLKRGLKKLVRGVSKGVSAAAGAVKAGADSITDRARRESMNHTDVKTIQELYNSIYESQQVDEEVERLDEISQKTATKAYAASSTGEFEGQDSPRDVKRTDNLRRQIKRKFGDKAAQHADRAAHAMTFGRNSKFMKMPKKPTNEELELDENRRAARAAGGFVDDSKKQTDPSKPGFTGISDNIKDIMRQNKEIEAANKKKMKKEELEATGKFTAEEIEAILNVNMEEGYKEISFDKHQRMYDRYKKLSKAAMQDARDSGEASGDNRRKMGKMSTVIDKSSENLRKKQTKDQLTGRG